MGIKFSRSAVQILGTLVFVRQNYAALLQRFGKYHTTLKPGLNIKIPLVDEVAFVHDLREQAIEIDSQVAITKDNVALRLDAILFIQVVDPYKASYGIEKIISAISNLAQTTMRSEIGKLTLDKTFEERESLNHHIVNMISPEVEAWGVNCLRYEIRDIEPPTNIKKSMILQAESERQKRADILKSEGERQAAINLAEGERMAKSLRAEGRADATIQISKASADALKSIGSAIDGTQGRSAASFMVADHYINSYRSLGRKQNTLLVDTSPINVAGNIGEAFDILNRSLTIGTIASAKSTSASPNMKEVKTEQKP